MEINTPAALPHYPKFVKWALMLGIIVILNIFFNVIIALAYPAPDYNDYCPNTYPAPAPTTAATCSEQGGIWTPYSPDMIPADKTLQNPTGFCDMYAQCQRTFQTAFDEHALYAFVIMVGLGIFAILAGLMPTGSSIVSSGLSYGGVLAFIIASIQYWGSAGNWVRLAIAGAGLVTLLYIGWKKFKD